jgi:hypothetical protein
LSRLSTILIVHWAKIKTSKKSNAGVTKMIGLVRAFKSTGLPAVFVALVTLIALTEVGLPKDGNDGSRSHSTAIVSDGTVIASISNGPSGLKVSSTIPGMITITSGSNSVSVRGDAVTLSGADGLAPEATAGVTVTPDKQGGYTAILDTSIDSDLGR